MRASISVLTCGALLLAQMPSASAQSQFSRADYEVCQTQDDATFRKAIEAITQKSLADGLVGVDYRSVVADEWRRLNLDATLDKQVDIAVEEVRNEQSLGSLVRSIANKEKAQELATAVAERVYRSEPVKTAIENLATGVGSAVGKRIELASADAAEPALNCLKAFLGPRYGTTVAGTVAGNAGQEFGLDPDRGGASVSSGAVLKQSGAGITGAAILIMRRQLANMAARVGQRIVGSVLARLVSVVAGGIGLVLIAKDIWELRKGVLPIIADEMKAKATKDKVQEELASSLNEQIGEHVKEIGSKAADRVVEIWQEFRRAHAKVLDLAERNAGFRNFLDSVPPDRLARLDEITGLVLQAEGEAGVLKRLDNGTLEEAVKTAPPAVLDIARETRNLDLALKWSSLAGEQLQDVVSYELHRRSSPEQFTKASLTRLFAIGDRLAILRLGALDRDSRDILFERNPDELKQLARTHNEAELTALARYLTALPQAPRDRVLGAVIADASVMQVLSKDRVRDGILTSRDPAAAVEMMLRPASRNPADLANDLVAAWDGNISPVLIWEKHPMMIVAAGIALLALLLLIRRLFSPRRRTVTTAS